MINSIAHFSGGSASENNSGPRAADALIRKNSFNSSGEDIALNVRTSPEARVSLRVDPANPDHHIWNNNGTWWCHYTEHLPDYTKRRVRVSLRTSDVEAARRRRDHLLAALANAPAN